MRRTDILESAILQELARVGICSLDELNERLPSYSWNQVFSEVDRLNREGTVALKHPAPFLCFLWLVCKWNQAVTSCWAARWFWTPSTYCAPV